MVDSACIRQLAQHGHHRKIQRRVEARGRFVENQQFGAEGPVHAVGCELDSSLTACVLPARTVTASDGEGDAEEDAGDGDTGDTGTGDTVVVATAAGRGCCCRCARAGLAVYVADP